MIFFIGISYIIISYILLQLIDYSHKARVGSDRVKLVVGLYAVVGLLTAALAVFLNVAAVGKAAQERRGVGFIWQIVVTADGEITALVKQ